ncbi:MAG: hypothetical protein ACLPKE_24080 [Streptosporangiaceae bacterium]
MTPARDRDGDGDGDGRTLAGWENRLRGGPSDKAFSSAELEGLPELVRRYLLAPTAGFVVLLGYTMAALAVAAFVLARRDA